MTLSDEYKIVRPPSVAEILAARNRTSHEDVARQAPAPLVAENAAGATVRAPLSAGASALAARLASTRPASAAVIASVAAAAPVVVREQPAALATPTLLLADKREDDSAAAVLAAKSHQTSDKAAPTLLRRRPLPRPFPSTAPANPSTEGNGWQRQRSAETAAAAVNARRRSGIEFDTHSSGVSPDDLLRSVMTTLNDLVSARRNQARVLDRGGAASPELALAGVEIDAELIRLRAYIAALSSTSSSWVEENTMLTDSSMEARGAVLSLLREGLA
jgi:hypothetical protein